MDEIAELVNVGTQVGHRIGRAGGATSEIAAFVRGLKAGTLR